MALVVADRVQETTSTTGTSDYALLGAEQGFQAFGDVMSDGDTTYYSITDDTDWEVGIGTYSTTGPTLARTTILDSSNAGAAVSWGVGTKNIFLTYAADRSVYLNANGDLSVDGTTLYVDSTNNRVGAGTLTPANRLDVVGEVVVACVFTSTVSSNVMDVTAVTSGSLAVGQYVTSGNVTAKITALGTGTGGVGTYTLDKTFNASSYNTSYLAPTQNTLRLGNTSTTLQRFTPHGSIEFYGESTTAGPRAIIRSTSGASSVASSYLDMQVGTSGSNGAREPDTILRVSRARGSFANNVWVGDMSLVPSNTSYGFAQLTMGGSSSTLPGSGSSLGTFPFFGTYVDAGMTYSNISYGRIGYVVDGSPTAGQLPSAFTVQTRNAAGTIAERFRIDKDGNVGIGTTSMSRKLQVNGDASVETNLSVFGYFNVGNAADFTVDTAQHRVGINTALPAYSLDVNGTANATTLAIGGTAITATATELNYVDGVTSNIQTQLDAKGPTGGGTDSLFFENGQTMTTNYTIAATKNAMSTGPITIDPGVTLTVETGARYVVI